MLPCHMPNSSSIKKPKTSYHHGNLKKALLETALDIIDKQGLSHLTVRLLGQHLNISRSAIYRHFDSKESLIHEVLLAGFEKLDSVCDAILLEKEKSITQRLFDMGHAYLDFAIRHPNLYRIMFGHEVQETREEKCDITDKDLKTGFHALVDLLQQGQNEGIFVPCDPMIQALMTSSVVHGLASLHIDGHLHIQQNLQIIFELSFKTLLEGITPR